MTLRVAVVGGGIAGVTSATHLVELHAAEVAAGGAPQPLEVHLFSTLVPDPGGPGNGVGGKAMSRSHVGYDSEGLDRRMFYGPMMPYAGTVPHGYHIIWEYPNLRRMLGDGADDEGAPPFDGGLMLPRGGAGHLAVFQGRVDDPAPGGPGIAIMGLSDPSRPESATRPATQALFRLRDHPVAQAFRAIFEPLFEPFVGDDSVNPLFYADLLFTHELDLEIRLALILASLRARNIDPERETCVINGQRLTLDQVEADDWARSQVSELARAVSARWQNTLGARLLHEIDTRADLAEVALEAMAPVARLVRLVQRVLPPAVQDDIDGLKLVTHEIERVVRHVPAALANLGTGTYPFWRTLHLRFAPDATFTSPYSYDAAQAVRSLAFVFRTPSSSRCWSADGARINRLWVRLWDRLRALAAATPGVNLHLHTARVTSMSPVSGGMQLRYGRPMGHGYVSGPTADLSWPHTHSQRAALPEPPVQDVLEFDAVVPAVPPDCLAELLALWPDEQARLAPLIGQSNATLEIVIWTRDRIVWSGPARAGLQASSITGLEGGWCLLADYSQGLWSDATLREEDPFGEVAGGVPFGGSIMESCGAFDEIWSCLSRDDAFGWSPEVKGALADLLGRPEHFVSTDQRTWPNDLSAWKDKRVGGTWTEDRAASIDAHGDHNVASRWLAWQFLHQLSQCQVLGPQAVRQLSTYAALLDPRKYSRAEILNPAPALQSEVRYVVMVNAKARNRIFSPGVGTWRHRPVSGAPLAQVERVFPAGDWTRNGLDIICMEAATLSGMRAARGAWQAISGVAPGPGAPPLHPVLPSASWYGSLDPSRRD
jgi:hypothetical protein